MKKINLSGYKQNKPSLIAADFFLNFGVCRDATMEILLNRGVFKWFTVRRKLIRLKYKWKDRITSTLSNISRGKAMKDWEHVIYNRGFLAALVECRKEVRWLCHSERCVAPDNDTMAIDWLEKRCREEQK